MIQDKSLTQVSDRLAAIEVEVQTMKARLIPQQPEAPYFEFILSVNGQEVWRGLNLEERCCEILRESPDAEIIIDWDSSPIVLI